MNLIILHAVFDGLDMSLIRSSPPDFRHWSVLAANSFGLLLKYFAFGHERNEKQWFSGPAGLS